ncbi:alpha/beta fold hydrolase [Paradevosia shaoguanensis]|uniref:Alpha/beta hydrolase n=1 Tax=Paradevosia shaoguanensis TaxID=1335043 RepID=A0AA41UEK5_9HYPH|nr:alpha/beta hydrolase [Paradevosia shaoguanensis]MCF1741093.1 alpha/beta hydrolase [Paradevosia shaoguanensis]MCI0125576.1 alpha/beta hydrolase [Paradevosia shaoguanensis]
MTDLARQPLPAERRWGNPTALAFQSSGLALAATQWGEDHGSPPIVLLHGWKDHGRMWDAVGTGLAARYRVIAPDLRGHGDSAWSPDGDYSILAMLGDLNALIDQHAGGPVSLVAHSMGADIAMRFAAAFPEKVKSLLAIEGFGLGAAHRRRLFRRPVHDRYRRAIMDRNNTSNDHSYTSVADARARFARAHPKFSAELVDRFLAHGLRHDAQANVWFWKRDPKLVAPAMLGPELNALRQLWRHIDCPVLHLRGGASPFADPQAEGLADCFRTARYAVFEGAGHWVHQEQPERFMALLEEFLA